MKCRIDITGRKVWNDNNNMYGTRPSEVEIRLLRDGDIFKTVTLNPMGSGRYKFPCLIVWNSSGVEYDYSVDEAPVNGYTKRIQGFNITNTLDTMSIAGTKTWDDNHNAEGSRPASITLVLLQNGKHYRVIDLVTPAGEDIVPFSIPDVPFADSEGNPFVYTIDEGTVAGYRKTVSGFNITNTLITGGFSFTKTSTATGFSLQGAVFEIRQNGMLISTSASDAAGKVSFSGLIPGSYQMAETVPPVGYMDNTDIYDVEVSADGAVTVNGMPADQFSVRNTPEARILLRRATAALPAYMAAPNTWPLHGTIQPDLYMLDKILITLPQTPVTVKWAYGVQDEAYFRAGGGIDITATYQDGFPAPLNTDYTVYVMSGDGSDAVASITVDRLRDGSEEMPYLLINFSTADALEPDVSGIGQFTLYYMQGDGVKLTQHYEIYEDIDMEGKEWEPIGPLQTFEFFTGSLYGNGNDIANLTIENPETGDYLGLFRFVSDGAKIQNLNLVNCHIESYHIAAGFAAYPYTRDGGTILMKDLHFNGSLKGIVCGGITGVAGAMNGPFIIDSCTADGDIESREHAGGITGYCETENNNLLSISNCYSSGSLTGEYSSGIVGILISNGSADISNCVNTMTVNASRLGGGIVAIISGTGAAVISSCYNKGDLSGGAVGGIAGGSEQQILMGFKIINCYNSGTVNAAGGGGIYCDYTGSIITQNCYNTGNVISSSYAGGVSANYGNIENCAALNASVSGNYQTARISPVANPAGIAVLNNNVAFENMQVLIGGVPKDPLDTGSAGADGISVTAAEIKTQTLYETTLGWDFTSVWSFGSGAYTLPVLRGIPLNLQPDVLPPHL